MYGLYRYVKYPNSYQVGSVSHSSIKFPHDIPIYKAMAVPSSYMGCHIWYGQPMLWELEVYLCHLQGLREYPHQIGPYMVQYGTVAPNFRLLKTQLRKNVTQYKQQLCVFLNDMHMALHGNIISSIFWPWQGHNSSLWIQR